MINYEIGIISSLIDPASINMAKNLIEISDCELVNKTKNNELYYCDDIRSQLLIINSDLIDLEKLPSLEINPSRLIFLSRHSSTAKILSLSIHFTGNWTSEAKYGGKPFSLGISDPLLGKIIFNELNRIAEQEKLEKIPISLEATHHGPTELNKPLIFVEIGSDIDAWKNEKLGYLWAVTLYESLRRLLNRENNDYIPAVGFGGPHYAPNFTEIERRTRIAMGHIAPKYVIDQIDKRMILQAINRSKARPALAIIDWKGLNSEQRNKILNALRELTEIEVVRARNILSKGEYS